jgi:hypothetical protein
MDNLHNRLNSALSKKNKIYHHSLDAKFCTELHDMALRILYKLVVLAEKVTTLGPKLAQLSGNFLRAWELLMHTKYTNAARV